MTWKVFASGALVGALLGPLLSPLLGQPAASASPHQQRTVAEGLRPAALGVRRGADCGQVLELRAEVKRLSDRLAALPAVVEGGRTVGLRQNGAATDPTTTAGPLRRARAANAAKKRIFAKISSRRLTGSFGAPRDVEAPGASTSPPSSPPMPDDDEPSLASRIVHRRHPIQRGKPRIDEDAEPDSGSVSDSTDEESGVRGEGSLSSSESLSLSLKSVSL